MSEQPNPPLQPGLILDHIEDAIIVVDQQGIVTFFNQAAQLFTGLSEKYSLGRTIDECFPEQEQLCQLIRTVLSKGRTISNHHTITLKATGKRPRRPVSIIISPIFSLAGQQQGTVTVLHDMTRFRALEDAARPVDNITLVGTMAAGLAHEIKNPLGGIKGAAQLLQSELEGEAELLDYPRMIIREAERANRIIEELLNLSRPREQQNDLVNIGQLLDEIIEMEKIPAADRQLRLIRRLDPSLPEFSADRDLLVRLFQNIIRNACEASPKGGEIVVESGINADYHFNLPGLPPIPMFQVVVHDQGPGIPPAELAKIFTPFYTTKTGGSGLGLAICQKIVADHDGLMFFEEQQQAGTSVRVVLPLRQPRHDTSDQAD